MAETNTTKTLRHVASITVTDGAPLAYVLPVHGELTFTPGGYNLVDFKNADGSFTGISPTRGEENPTTFTINAVQRGNPGLLSGSQGLIDYILNSGVAAQGTATSTGTETASVSGEHEVMFDVAVVITDHVGSKTYTFEDCTFVGSSLAAGLEGNQITLSGSSRKAYPIIS